MKRTSRWDEFEQRILNPTSQDDYEGFDKELIDRLIPKERARAEEVLLGLINKTDEWSLAMNWWLWAISHMKLTAALPRLQTLLDQCSDNPEMEAVLATVLLEFNGSRELEQRLLAIAGEEENPTRARTAAICGLPDQLSDEALALFNSLRTHSEIAIASTASMAYHLAIQKDPSRALPLPGEDEPTGPMTKHPLPGPAPVTFARKKPWWKFWVRGKLEESDKPFD